MVWMMSSINWPGWLGSSWDIQRLLDPPGDQRNIQNVGVHRRDGEKADEAVLDDWTIPRIGAPLRFAHHDDVGVGAVAQEARQGGRGQRHQFAGLAQLGQHIGA